MKKIYIVVTISVAIFIVTIGIGSMVYVNKVIDKMVEGDIHNSTPIVPRTDIYYNNTKESVDTRTGSRTNILLIGIDDARSDTIMIISIDTKLKRGDLISVPRDTYYYRKGYERTDQKKINGAYGIRGDDMEKSRSVAQAVSNILGVSIDYYVRLDFEAVKKIVDHIGGVSIYVDRDMYYIDEDGSRYLMFEEGEQILYGERALDYVRYRQGYADGDLGRIRVQQDFVLAAAKKALSISNLFSTIETLSDYIKTNMPPREIKNLTKLVIDFNSYDIESHVIPGKFAIMEGLYFYIHDDVGTRELINSVVGK